MIIETAANQLFYVVPWIADGAEQAHAWGGLEVKRIKGGFAPKAKARKILVRKLGCKIINSAPVDCGTFWA